MAMHPQAQAAPSHKRSALATPMPHQYKTEGHNGLENWPMAKPRSPAVGWGVLLFLEE